MTFSFIVRTTIASLCLISLLWNIGGWRAVISPAWWRQPRSAWHQWRDAYIILSFVCPLPLLAAVLTQQPA